MYEDNQKVVKHYLNWWSCYPDYKYRAPLPLIYLKKINDADLLKCWFRNLIYELFSKDVVADCNTLA